MDKSNNNLKTDIENSSAKTLKIEQLIAEEKDICLKATALKELGLIEAFRKNFDKAIIRLEEAQKLFLQEKDYNQIASCLAELAIIYYQNCNDRLIRSLTLLNDAKYLVKNQNLDSEIEAKVLHYYGIIYYFEKRYSEALRNYKNAQKLIDTNCLEYAKILDSLSIFYLRINNNQIALKNLNKSLKIKQNIGNERELAITELLIGRYLSSIENYDTAFIHLTRAHDITFNYGDYLSAARILDELAKIYLAQDKYKDANEYCLQSIDLAEQVNAELVYAFSNCTLALIKINTGNPEEAVEFLNNKIQKLFLKYNSSCGQGHIKRINALAYHKMQKNKVAIENLHIAAQLFKEASSHSEMARTYYELSIIYKESRDIPMALSSLLEALRIARFNNLPALTNKIEDFLFEIDEDEWANIINKTAQKEVLFKDGSSILETLSLIDDITMYDNSSKDALLSLLRIGRSIAAETDIDKLLEIIAGETKRALNADRCTVFLLDKETNELWSKVALGMGSQEIRFPAHMGLAGHVASSGEIINIKDTYNDPRFNKEIDKKTGYTTKSILCMPMRNLNHEIVGVFQVLNKLGENAQFTDSDEDLLIAIGSSAGIALENARLFKKQFLMYEEQKRSFLSFMNTLAAVIDARDKITAGHSKRVAGYSIAIAIEMNMDLTSIEILEYAAMLHDFGKIGIKDSVLCKRGKLTDEEYKHIQEHVTLTNEILQNMYFEEKFKDVPEIASSHHEKYDGTGYHQGLKGEEIPFGGRILAVSDVFDAITSKRHYRDRMPLLDALNILISDKGKHFDGNVVDAFFNVSLDKIIKILLLTQDEDLPKETEELLSRYNFNDIYTILNKNSDDITEKEHELIKIFYKYYETDRH